MSFGQCFTRVESAQLVAEGEHTVELGIPRIVNRQGWNILECPIKYLDDEGEEPRTFSLVEPQDYQDKKAVTDFNRQATRIFDCFDLQNDFSDIMFPSWKGHQGKVIVEKDKNGFLRVKKFVPSEAVLTRLKKQKEGDIY